MRSDDHADAFDYKSALRQVKICATAQGNVNTYQARPGSGEKASGNRRSANDKMRMRTDRAFIPVLLTSHHLRPLHELAPSSTRRRTPDGVPPCRLSGSSSPWRAGAHLQPEHEKFFSADTFRTIANQIPAAVLIATAMTYVLVIAEIDLCRFGARAVRRGRRCRHHPVARAVARVGGGLATGLAWAFNGLVSLRWRLPSFIVTLGMLELARGCAHAVTGSRTQYIGADIEVIAGTTLLDVLRWIFGASSWIEALPLAWTLKVSLAFLFAIIAVVMGQLVLTRTVFGRYMVAVGTNEEAVRLSGIDPRPIKLAVFLITGALVAMAAIINISRYQTSDPNAGTGFELQAIAAAVIGGTSLMGGRGSVVSTFFGVLIIAVLNSGLAAVGAKDETKRLITGLVIVTAVVLDHYRHRLGRDR